MQRKRKSARKDPSNYHGTMLEQETPQREEANDRSRRRPEKGPKREEQVSKFRTSIPEDRE
jgi:hypothetical protein